MELQGFTTFIGRWLDDRLTVVVLTNVSAKDSNPGKIARHVAGMTQERDYLTRAADAYRLAIDHYSKAGDYANVSRSLGLVQRRLEQVQQRLSEIDDPPVKELLPRSADGIVPDSPVARRIPSPR